MKRWQKEWLTSEWTATQAKIKDYHIHIYFDPNSKNMEQSQYQARELADDIATLFPNAARGIYNVGKVGPHGGPNVEVDITKESFAEILQWLQVNGRGLSILIHPETGDDLKDHLESSLWLNRVTPYNDAFFARLRAGTPDAPVKKTGMSPN
jgi:DOPA 4,5-dioxygenase